MKHRAIEKLLERANIEKSDSDFTYFHSLLLIGEVLFKTVTLGIIAAIIDDKDRNRYRLEHLLVRADGLGDWAKAIEDALSGTASQYLLSEAYAEQSELSKQCKLGDWQYDSVFALKTALNKLDITSEDVPVKSDMKKWFRLFSTLRNKTRGHGAITPTKASNAIMHLEESLNLFYSNFSLFNREWAFLYRNLSGKYRVSPISDNAPSFDYLKKETAHNFINGVYIFFGSPRFVPLIHSDADLQDFFFSNGGCSGKKYELLSYYTSDKREGDAGIYLTPPGTLPASETKGHEELLVNGNCFSNVPELISEYIPRQELERQLFQLLFDDRREIITLLGRGGIGKTSLSIKVITQLYNEKRYDAIVWFSARDVDLQPNGPKPVRPVVYSPEDISKLYAGLVFPQVKLRDKNFKAKEFFEQQLQKCEIGPCLFVFDNFETTQNPIELFLWIDTYIRLPNKVLITTRLRDFKGDYPVEVSGMEDSEARALVSQTAKRLKIETLLRNDYIDELIYKSEGHPYVIKILLGEVARAGKLTSIKQIVAGSDDILTALFERTYASLTPCAQRAFMTLAGWNSLVPRLALEAVLIRSTAERQEIEKGIESLIQFSMAEIYVSSSEEQEFISLPLVAGVFGKRKLKISPFKAAIQIDVDILQMFGSSRRDDINLGLARRLEKFIANIAKRVDSGESYDNYASILEMICRTYNLGWLIMARWHMESGTQENYEKAKNELILYLENDSKSDKASEAWRILGRAYNLTNDALGEIHAFVERAQISSVPFYDISNTANRLNRIIREHVLEDQEVKRELIERLLAVLKKRQQEACADDFSRMAWLARHIGQESDAQEYAKAGLALDPYNDYCLGILERNACLEE
ncbi:MAG: hypothetical protein CTY19_14130 [Methylomonas sp.]|nr:MAG: hypothetical protein CTY19_14130 [Methylomonas sp.]